ncbi:MAG: hypothetical protein F6J87_26520 [Spirulina sp. SIO3F2]|nr:hypothetical protein [Spirulina sp. SIO3F2]
MEARFSQIFTDAQSTGHVDYQDWCFVMTSLAKPKQLSWQANYLANQVVKAIRLGQVSVSDFSAM